MDSQETEELDIDCDLSRWIEDSDEIPKYLIDDGPLDKDCFDDKIGARIITEDVVDATTGEQPENVNNDDETEDDLFEQFIELSDNHHSDEALLGIIESSEIISDEGAVAAIDDISEHMAPATNEPEPLLFKKTIVKRKLSEVSQSEDSTSVMSSDSGTQSAENSPYHSPFHRKALFLAKETETLPVSQVDWETELRTSREKKRQEILWKAFEKLRSKLQESESSKEVKENSEPTQIAVLQASLKYIQLLQDMYFNLTQINDRENSEDGICEPTEAATATQGDSSGDRVNKSTSKSYDLTATLPED